MSSKKPSTLRNALREMRVNEPLRLSKSGPSFRPPEPQPQKEVPPTEVPLPGAPLSEAFLSEVPPFGAPFFEAARTKAPQNEASEHESARIKVPQNEVAPGQPPRTESANFKVTHTEAAQVKSPQNEDTQTKVAPSQQTQSEIAQKEAAQSERPRSEHVHNEQTPSEVPKNEAPHRVHARNEQPQSDVPRTQASRKEAPRNEPPQKEVTRFEATQIVRPRDERPQNEVDTTTEVAQNEPPQIEPTNRGFFRLSDRTFSYPQLQQLSGDCFRLFLWMSSRGWRYQKSDGSLRASVGFIEIHTAMSHATISRCLKTLRESSLIELLETDYKRGNVWSISPIAFAGCEPENLPPRSELPRNEAPRKDTAAPSKRDRTSLNLRAKPPQNEEQIISIKKYKNLSQEDAEEFFARITKIRAPEKQRTEREGLIRLLETYGGEEIRIALTYVDKYGTLSGETCHSPFRYLATAMDDVLQLCRKKGINSAAASNSKPVSGNADSQEEKRREEVRKQAAFAAFQNDLTPDARATFVTEYVAKEFAWGYQPSESLAVRLAAMAWFDEREFKQAAGQY